MSHLVRSTDPAIAHALDYLRTFTDWEQSLPADARRTFDLGRVRTLLSKVGDPHLGRPAVHVTGTKGKGSVVLLADAILRAHGTRTFRFVSPHVERLNERIAIDGRDVSDETLAAAIFGLRPVIEEMMKAVAPAESLTFFEVLTAAGFLVARESRVDADVVEVGLGGRLDATNVIDPSVSVITSIGLDHTKILGRTRDKIAAEKAGIIKPGKPVLVGLAPKDPGFDVIVERARACGAPASWLGHGIAVESASFGTGRGGRPGARFAGRVGDLRIEDAFAPGGGVHQATNALLAIGASVEVLRALGRTLDERTALGALENAELPARAELFDGRPPVLIDGAHTGASCAALVELVRRLFAGRGIVLLGGLTRERSVRSLFSPFLKLTGRAIFAPLPTPRSTDPEEAAAGWRALGGDAAAAPEPAAGLERALAAAGPLGAVVVAGSFYLAGAVRPALRARENASAGRPAPGR